MANVSTNNPHVFSAAVTYPFYYFKRPSSFFRLAKLLLRSLVSLSFTNGDKRVYIHTTSTQWSCKRTHKIYSLSISLPTESAKEEKRLVDATVSDGYYKKKKKSKKKKSCTKFSSSSKEASELPSVQCWWHCFCTKGWGHVGSSKSEVHQSL